MVSDNNSNIEASVLGRTGAGVSCYWCTLCYRVSLPHILRKESQQYLQFNERTLASVFSIIIGRRTLNCTQGECGRVQHNLHSQRV